MIPVINSIIELVRKFAEPTAKLFFGALFVFMIAGILGTPIMIVIAVFTERELIADLFVDFIGGTIIIAIAVVFFLALLYLRDLLYYYRYKAIVLAICAIFVSLIFYRIATFVRAIL